MLCRAVGIGEWSGIWKFAEAAILVLVMDDRDRVVIDVIYKDDGSGIGVTAMELQYPRPTPRSGP